MAKYADFTAEKLAQDGYFRQWVQQPDEETNQFWSDFLMRYPNKRPMVRSARALLIAVERMQVVPTQEQGQRMWASIEQHVRQESPVTVSTESTRFRIGFRWEWMAAAASVALLVGLGWWFMLKPETVSHLSALSGKEQQSASAWVEKTNQSQKPLLVVLEDGSRVTLQPQSTVRYPAAFSDLKREVELTGEGFFDVTRNPEKPFMVFANGLVTQVVGTSFSVTGMPNMAQVTVIVRTGKVAVFPLTELRKAQHNQTKITNSVLLVPNQQVVFDKSSDQLTKSLIKAPVLLKLPQSNQPFVFENTPVSTIFQTLEDSYGVTIKYNAELLKSCNLTAPMGNEPFFQKLDLICQTIGATYEVWGTDIIISGKGCQ